MLSAAPSAIAAPVQVAAGRAAGAARRDGGAGLCLTAIRSGGFSSVDEAVLLLGRPPGGAVLDKTGGKVPAVNLRGGDPASVGDFSGEGASESPMPFTGAPGAMPPGDDRDLALRLRGYLSVPLPQTLTLGVFAGAPYRLRVGGVVVSESPAGALSSRVSQNVQFGGAGLYPIEILYAHKSGPAFLELSRGPGSAPASDNVELPFGGAFQIVQAAELFPSLSTAAAACAECDSDLDCPGSQSCRDGLCQDCSAPGACSGGGSGGGGGAGGGLDLRGGCQAAPGGGDATSLALVLAALAALRRRRPRGPHASVPLLARSPRRSPERGAPAHLAALLAALVLLLGAGAQAQPAYFNAQPLRPALGPGSLISVESSATLGHLRPMAKVLFEYGHLPLRIVDPASGALVAAPVSGMFTAHVLGGIGLTRRLSLMIGLPIVLYQGYDAATPAGLLSAQPKVAGLGDLRLRGKISILDGQRRGLGLAVVPEITFPTGAGDELRGASTADPVATIEARLALDYRLPRDALLLANLGFQGRLCRGLGDGPFGCDQVALNARLSHLLTFGAGAAVPLARGASLLGELQGAVSLGKTTGERVYSPLELLLGARYVHRSGIQIEAGGGANLVPGVAAAPLLRVFAAVAYLPSARTPARAPEPAAPAVKRALTPESDADHDGVIDRLDRCPKEAGPRDNGGCPDGDGDGDGVIDRLDRCPKGAGSKDSAGCPEPDGDGDGVVDRLDRCPKEAGPRDNSGCPDLDGDKDGVVDRLDRCPKEAGPKEGGGCPEPDGDGDGVSDRLDQCPKEAGPRDVGGCPPIERDGARLRLRQPIRFAPGSVDALPASRPVIAALGQALADPSIKKARIDVGASGDKKAAKKLAAARAKWLLGALVEAGAPKKALQVKPQKRPGQDEIREVACKLGKVKAPKRKRR